MTRFARARGSKASNERLPQPATDWNEMKQQLLETNGNKRKNANDDENEENFKKMRAQNYEKFLNEQVDNQNNTEWAEFDVKQHENNQSEDDEAPVEVSSKQTPIATVVKPVRNKSKPNKIVDIKPQGKNKILKAVKKETRLIEQKKKRQLKQLLKKMGKDDDKVEIASQESVEATKDPTESTEKAVKSNERKQRLTELKQKKLEKQLLEKKGGDPQESLEETTKDPSELTKKELKLIERKQKRRLARLANKQLKKQQKNDNNPEIVNNNNGPTIDKKKQKFRKPIEEIQVINGRQVAVTYMDSFPIKKEDYQRLVQLKKDLISKNIPQNEIAETMKLERRKAEKSLTRERKNVCYKCRKSGHNLSECPETNNEHSGSGICFKCGSTEHTHFQCKVVKNDEYRYASCFICGAEGHIARQCKDNDRGVYPKGGNCNVCGSTEHLKKDCPQFKQQQQSSDDVDLVVGTLNNNENPEIENVDNEEKTKKTSKKIKKVKF